MPSRVVYFNGRYVPEAEARLHIYDSALVRGDMAFEVTRTYRQQPFRLREHLARLFHSLAVLRTDPGMTIDELEQATLETLAHNLPTEPEEVDWDIIHNVSRGPASGFDAAFARGDMRPTVVISCIPITWKLAPLAGAYHTGLNLVVPPQLALPRELVDASIKTRSRVHYQLANMQAGEMQRGAIALLVDPDGFLTEGTSGNVFVVRGGELLTPEARNLLPGITRDVVLGVAHRIGVAAREANIAVAEAAAAEEMFLTSTSIGILHARSFNGELIGSGAIGELTSRLREALIAEVGVDFVAQAKRYAELMKGEPEA